MQTYYDVGGNQIKLGDFLGKGGEASVFNIVGQPKLAVKIYKETPSSETIQKLHKLIDMPAITNTAWPLKLVFESNSSKTVVGYLMPKAEGVKTWNNFNVEISRTQVKGYNYTPTFFHNMLTSFVKVLSDVHSAGLIIGDINCSNALIDRSGYCMVIDVDSFQVGSQFLCTVARPEFLAPPLQSASLECVVRDQSHDRFAMGVLFFTLICNGIHPHQGIGQPNSIPERIKANLCIGSSLYKPPKFQYDVNKLPTVIRQLFIRAFTLVPTTNQEWLSALTTHKKELESFINDSLKLKPTSKYNNTQTVFRKAQSQQNYQANVSKTGLNISWLKYGVAALCCLLIVKVLSDSQSHSQSPIHLISPSKFLASDESSKTFTDQHADVFRTAKKQDIDLPKVKSIEKKESFKEIHKKVFKIKDNK
jgi:DNA-binding helix-hairpin-helix protein with protein kinase domain